jgi:hypothetical protein
LKALREIDFDDYYQAEQEGWVLYLEGSTDLAILQAFAATLPHKAVSCLERPFVHYIGNQPKQAADHFYGLREAKADLVGVAILDRLEQGWPSGFSPQTLRAEQWRKREIENYLCRKDVLLAYARGEGAGDLWASAEAARREAAMHEAIARTAAALEELGEPSPWSADIKASDQFLDRVFRRYFEALGLPNLLSKSNYHELARLVPKELIDDEVTEKLDAIVEVAERATPRH